MPVGTIDITNNGQEVFCKEPRRIVSRQSSEKMDIIFDNQALVINCRSNKYYFVENVFDPQNEVPKSGYEHYYDALVTVQENALHGEMNDYRMIEDMLYKYE